MSLKGTAETEHLKSNLEDQLDRLMNQLADLEECGILNYNNTYLYIILSSLSVYQLKRTSALIIHRYKKAQLYTVNQNLFEFPGIHTVWNLACYHPDAMFLYFHSKGSSYSHGVSRSKDEKRLFFETVSSWRFIIQLFELMPEVPAMGVSPAEKGWIWYNFWWARGSYLATRVEPGITMEDRYYYESWLATTASHNWCNSIDRNNPDQILVNATYVPVDTQKYPTDYQGAYCLSICDKKGGGVQQAIDWLQLQDWKFF